MAVTIDQQPGKIRLADTLPPYCAACFNAQPHLRHVDFDAASDRGYGMEASVMVTMDELVLCENCVRLGGLQIGMVDPPEVDENAQLRVKLEDAERRCLAAENYAARLEDTISVRPEKVRRPPGRPRKHVEES